MFAKDREAMRLTPAEVRLILIESLQWCANNAVYFLGLIGAATYDLAGTAFLVAAITLVRNLMTSVGNMVSGSVIDRFGPRRTSFVTCVITAVLSLGVGLAPLSVPGLVFAACVLGLAGGFINTCTHAFPGYLESTTEGRTRVNGLMVFYSNIAYTAGPLLGGAIVSCFATQSVYLLMAGMMGVAAVLSLGCHECVAPAKGEKPKGGILGGMAEGARLPAQLEHRLLHYTWPGNVRELRAFSSNLTIFYQQDIAPDQQQSLLNDLIRNFFGHRISAFTDCSEPLSQEDRLLLNSIQELTAAGRPAGRGSLLRLSPLLAAGFTEAKLKLRIRRLAESGYISVGKTRQGLRLTLLGTEALAQGEV